jgi:hypothetical protein
VAFSSTRRSRHGLLVPPPHHIDEVLRHRSTTPRLMRGQAPPPACAGELRRRPRPEPIRLSGGAAARWASQGDRSVAAVPRAGCGRERGGDGRKESKGGGVAAGGWGLTKD